MILSDSLFAKSSHSLRTDIDHVLGGGDEGDDVNGDVNYDSLHAKSSHSLTEDWAPICLSISQPIIYTKTSKWLMQKSRLILI